MKTMFALFIGLGDEDKSKFKGRKPRRQKRPDELPGECHEYSPEEIKQYCEERGLSHAD